MASSSSSTAHISGTATSSSHAHARSGFSSSFWKLIPSQKKPTTPAKPLEDIDPRVSFFDFGDDADECIRPKKSHKQQASRVFTTPASSTALQDQVHPTTSVSSGHLPLSTSPSKSQQQQLKQQQNNPSSSSTSAAPGSWLSTRHSVSPVSPLGSSAPSSSPVGLMKTTAPRPTVTTVNATAIKSSPPLGAAASSSSTTNVSTSFASLPSEPSRSLDANRSFAHHGPLSSSSTSHTHVADHETGPSAHRKSGSMPITLLEAPTLSASLSSSLSSILRQENHGGLQPSAVGPHTTGKSNLATGNPTYFRHSLLTDSPDSSHYSDDSPRSSHLTDTDVDEVALAHDASQTLPWSGATLQELVREADHAFRAVDAAHPYPTKTNDKYNRNNPVVASGNMHVISHINPNNKSVPGNVQYEKRVVNHHFGPGHTKTTTIANDNTLYKSSPASPPPPPALSSSASRTDVPNLIPSRPPPPPPSQRPNIRRMTAPTFTLDKPLPSSPPPASKSQNTFAASLMSPFGHGKEDSKKQTSPRKKDKKRKLSFDVAAPLVKTTKVSTSTVPVATTASGAASNSNHSLPGSKDASALSSSPSSPPSVTVPVGKKPVVARRNRTLSDNVSDIFNGHFFKRVEADEMLTPQQLQDIGNTLRVRKSAESVHSQQVSDNDCDTPSEPFHLDDLPLRIGASGVRTSIASTIVPTSASSFAVSPLTPEELVTPRVRVPYVILATPLDDIQENADDASEHREILVAPRPSSSASNSDRPQAPIATNQRKSKTGQQKKKKKQQKQQLPNLHHSLAHLPISSVPPRSPLPPIPQSKAGAPKAGGLRRTQSSTIASTIRKKGAAASKSTPPGNVRPASTLALDMSSLESRENDDYLYLASNPYSLTCPGLRHGPIRFSKAEVTMKMAVDNTLDWTAFQMAILGAGDFFMERDSFLGSCSSAPTSQNRRHQNRLSRHPRPETMSGFEDDFASWFEEFGFETAGDLIEVDEAIARGEYHPMSALINAASAANLLLNTNDDFDIASPLATAVAPGSRDGSNGNHSGWSNYTIASNPYHQHTSQHHSVSSLAHRQTDHSSNRYVPHHQHHFSHPPPNYHGYSQPSFDNIANSSSIHNNQNHVVSAYPMTAGYAPSTNNPYPGSYSQYQQRQQPQSHQQPDDDMTPTAGPLPDLSGFFLGEQPEWAFVGEGNGDDDEGLPLPPRSAPAQQSYFAHSGMRQNSFASTLSDDSSLPSSPMMPIVVSTNRNNDSSQDFASGDLVHMSHNLNHDLGEFLRWESEYAPISLQ